MSKLRDLQQAVPKPATTVILTPSVWAADYVGRRSANECVGLRLLSIQDEQVARANAASEAWKLHPREADLENRWDAFGDALMCWAAGFAMCDPNDARKPFFSTFDGSEVGQALNRIGLTRCWDKLEEATHDESPVTPEADEEDFEDLPAFLADVYPTLSPARQQIVRRCLGRILAQASGG